MVEWKKTTVEWIKNYGRVDKKLWLSGLKTTTFLNNTLNKFSITYNDKVRGM